MPSKLPLFGTLHLSELQFMKINLEICPSETAHHQQAIDEAALAKVYSYISDTVAPQANPGFTHITGSFFAEYDEQRYLGPLSLVKYYYGLNIWFHHDDPDKNQHFIVTLVLDPVSSTFTERLPAFLDRPSHPRFKRLQCLTTEDI